MEKGCRSERRGNVESILVVREASGKEIKLVWWNRKSESRNQEGFRVSGVGKVLTGMAGMLWQRTERDQE